MLGYASFKAAYFSWNLFIPKVIPFFDLVLAYLDYPLVKRCEKRIS